MNVNANVKDEQLLIVDVFDNVLGEGYKKEIHKNRSFHRQVCLIVKNSNNQLLLQKRRSDKLFDPDCWTSAVTGHVTYKDSYDASIIKETKEEIGLDVYIKKLKNLGKIISYSDQNEQICGGPTMIYLMRKDLNLTNLKAGADEVTDLKWFDILSLKRQILENINPDNTIKFADDFIMIMKYYFLLSEKG